MAEVALENVLVPEAGEAGAVQEDSTTQPEAGQGSQNVAEPEAGTNAAAEGEDTPTGGTAKAKTQDDGAVVPKSQYDNLRRDYTKKAMELADIKKGRVKLPQQTEAQPAPQAQQVVQGAYTPPNTPVVQPHPYANVGEYLDSRVDAIVEESLEPIRQQQRTLEIQSTIKGLADKYDDFDDVAEGFLSVIEETPELFDVPNGLEIAYLAARNTYLEQNAQAIAIADMEARNEVIAQKQGLANVAGLAKPTQPAMSPEDQEAEDIKKSIMGGPKSSIFGI